MARSQTILKGFKLSGIIHLLHYTKKTIHFSELLDKSEIKFKKSFLQYLKFCIRKNLIAHYKTHGTRSQNRTSHKSWYVITDKGREFLRIIS